MKRIADLCRVLLRPTRKPGLEGPAAAQAAVDWLLFSQQQAQRLFAEGGFSRRYSLLKGWDRAYPETTGYIIPTLLNAAGLLPGRHERLLASVRTAGEWLLTIQNQDGSFNDVDQGRRQVFDTGQIIFGLSALHALTGEGRYREAAGKAAGWLVAVQEADGSWSRFACHFFAHTYYSRVAWSLAVAHALTGEAGYRSAAVRNLDWVLGQQRENGWFEHSGFVHKESLLHTIAYTLQGLIESAVVLGSERYFEAARKTAKVLLGLGRSNSIRSYYDRDWSPIDASLCLTGLAQTALVFKRIHQLAGAQEYLAMAERLDAAAWSRQIAAPGRPDVHGAIPGSSPLWGKYCPMSFPNWAPKFYLDSLLRTREIHEQRSYATYPG